MFGIESDEFLHVGYVYNVYNVHTMHLSESSRISPRRYEQFADEDEKQELIPNY